MGWCHYTTSYYLIWCWPSSLMTLHDNVIKWKHFPHYWPFVRGIHRSPVNSPHKGQWRGALMFTLICARIIGWVNNRKAGDLRRYRPKYDIVMKRHWTKEHTQICLLNKWTQIRTWKSVYKQKIISFSPGFNELIGYLCPGAIFAINVTPKLFQASI